jgi:hypothetical protein
MAVVASNQLCLVSMVLGIGAAALSFCCAFLGVPLGIAAVVTGIIGLSQVRADPRQQGRGQAIAGICCGGASFVLVGLFVLLEVGLAIAGP